VGTGGGSLAHATYNGGWTSTFYLVNTGTGSAQFTLSFFDNIGNPLSVPRSLPQTGATTTTSALTTTLAAGAMLLVQTDAQDGLPAAEWSTQLTTTGNISGCEIFQWITFGQEAAVPLETRMPDSFVMVFDDTHGLATGVALANVANSPASIIVNVRDDTGALLQTGSIDLAAQGHTSFLLPSVLYECRQCSRNGGVSGSDGREDQRDRSLCPSRRNCDDNSGTRQITTSETRSQ
jgi:hypothetical protein